ncbi:hypothetical protein DFJ77DRAFT_452715 [Powellomyces hirtus]|nr:hypothetical protein DFJ77DRAFT_452715 [Powellomyces hirtus]
MGAQSSKAARRFPTRPPAPSPSSAPPPPPSPSAAAAPLPQASQLPPQQQPIPPPHSGAAGGVNDGGGEADPRAEHMRLLEHFNRMAFDVHSFPKREYRKDNEMLGILASRSQKHAEDAYTSSERSSRHLASSSRRIPASELETLFGVRRSAGMTAAQLGDRFGVDETVVATLLTHFNTPEARGGAGAGGSEKMDGVWVDNMVAYRMQEAKDARSAI